MNMAENTTNNMVEYLRKTWRGWPFRVLFPVFLTVILYGAILFGVALPIMEKNIREQNLEGTQLLADAAWSVVQGYYLREQSGELTRAEAQRRAADRVRAMRYGKTGEDYFWINDTTPTLIAHPYRPDLEGVDLSRYEDPDGTKIFQAFVDAVQQSEGEYVQYLWQYQADATRVIPKYSYIRKFEPWGWIIGTGMYLDDIEAEVAAARQKVGAVSALGLAAVLLLSAIIVYSTLRLENQRRLAETELEHQRDFLSDVIQSLAHPLTVLNTATNAVELANEGGASFVTSPPYTTRFCVTHGAEILRDSEHQCPLDTVKTTRQPATVEHIYEDETGQRRHVEVHGYPILNAEGEVARVIEYSLDITDRKQAEILLREKEEQFRLLYERAPISYQSLDENGYFLTVNEAWLEELGYRKDEVIGHWFGDFLPLEDQDIFRNRFPLFKAAGEITDAEFDMLHKNGSRIRVSFTGKIGHDPQGNFQQTHCVFRNITEQRAAEEALIASERRYREISEIISDFAYSIRVLPDGKFQKEWATSSRISSLDIDFNQLLTHGESLVTLGVIHPEDESRYLDRIDAYSRREPVVTEYRMLSPDGKTHWVRHYGKPIWDEEENRPVRILGAIQDISEQKYIEEALRESEDRYRAIFERSYTPMMLIDPANGQIVEANLAASRFYGYSQDELKQMNTSDINTLEPAEVAKERQRAVREERNYFLFKHRLAHGEIRHVEVYSGPIQLEGRSLLYSLIHDVTQRVHSQEENLRLAAAIDQVNELIIMTDVQGKITYINPFFCEVTGYSREEVLGQPPRILKSGLHTESFYKQLWDTISSGKTWTGQFINRRKDGSLYHEEAIIFPVKDQHGRTLNYAAVKRDISEQIRTEQNIQRQVQRLSALRNIDLAISASLDLKLVLDILLEQTRRELGVDAADILLYNATFQKLELTAWQGFKSALSSGISLRVGKALPGMVAVTRLPAFVPDLSQKPSAELFSPQIRQAEQFAAYGCVPLVAKGELKGVLEVYHRAPLELADEWVEFLETLGGQAAIAIDNAGLFERLQAANTELMLAYDTTLEGWAKALELRDQETKGHSDNVTEITLQMAQEFGIASSELVHIRRGALLHDIGKMGIPDSILLKPGPLTPQEWEIMRKHPTYAYELLYPIAFLRPALEIPYCHHEHWDGSGYPRGLRGEDIPLAARIFAVVDVWEALSADRPYRKAWPKGKVIAYLREQSGAQFEPRLVDLFLEMLEDGQFQTDQAE